MCDICQYYCDQLGAIFGHKVDPKKLEELIESSPLLTHDELAVIRKRLDEEAESVE